MICEEDLDTMKPSGKDPWKKESGEIQFSVRVVMHGLRRIAMKQNADLLKYQISKCHGCLGLARPIDGKPVEHVWLGDQKLDLVESFILEMEDPQMGLVRLAPLQESVLHVERCMSYFLVNRSGNTHEK